MALRSNNNKMALAFGVALRNCIAEGRNPGHVGGQILRNEAKFNAVNMGKQKKRHTAESAGKGMM